MTSPGTSARNAAMNLLARREHSRLELKRKLARRFDPADVDDAIARLAEENLQSDARFAMSYTRERMLRGYGPLRIEHDLRQRGVHSQHIEAALNTVPREEGLCWLDVASAVQTRRFGAGPPATREEKAKRVRYLHYRGFTEMPGGLSSSD